MRLQTPESPAEIWLKLECLQPIGSFKIRGAANAIRSTARETIAAGVLTTSAGNMAQGVAWIAREEQVPATIIVPDHAPQTKLDAIERLGGRVIKVPFERWWQAMEEGAYPGVEGHFVHPVMDDDVMAGNGTIGLELVEELDSIATVLVPWGGGGLTTGIASALAQLSPSTRVIACEPETGAPLTASLAAGEPVGVDYTPSFVDGAGSKGSARSHVGARPPADRRRADAHARRDGLCGPAAGRAGTGGGGGSGRALCRCSVVRPRRRGPHRLHRLGRQHRCRPARFDPGRPHPGMTGARDQRGPRQCSSERSRSSSSSQRS